MPSWLLVASASALGALAFAQPLLGDGVAYGGRSGPLLLGATVALGLAVAVPEAGGRLGARAVALLAAIVAAASALRFVEVLLPGPGGFTPIFAPLILVGWAWGPRLGFLAGTLTMAVSAVATGGVGPWLPYQAIVAGWIGLTAGLLPGARGGRRPPRGAVAGLAAFGALWGIGYGALLSSWDWFALEAGRGGGGADTALHRYAAFYLATSLGWDVFGALGNAALIGVAGAPALAVLARFRRWFSAEDGRIVGSGAEPSQEPPSARDGATASRLPSPQSPYARGEAPLRAIRTRWTDGSEASSPRPLSPVPTGAPDAARVSARPATARAERAVPRDGTPPQAWLSWLVGVLVTASATRHPLVLGLAIVAIGTVRASAGPAPAGAALPLARLAPAMVAVAAVYNLLAAHQGTTVLGRLPAGIPVVGGALTLESLVYGMGAGLMLVALIAAFAAFQQAVSRPGLLALVPRAFGAPALAAAVALAWLPGTLAALATVREAQAVRGLGVGGPRGWSALVVPVVAGGLERAARLAESLALRGLVPAAAPTGPERAALAVAMALAAAGLLQALPATLALGLAAVVAGVTLGRVGSRLPKRAARWAWRPADLGVAACAWLPVALVLFSPAARATLAWSPYPTLSLAPLDPWVLIACAGIAAPALLVRGAARGRGARPVLAMRVEVAGSGDGRGSAGAPGTGDGAVGHPKALAVVFDRVWFAYDGARAPARRKHLDAQVPAHMGNPLFSGRGARPCALFGFARKEGARPCAPTGIVSGQVLDDPYDLDPDTPTSHALRAVSFAPPPGRLSLITGPSGSGKSTLLRIACGIVPSLTGGRLSGTVRVGDLDVCALGPEQLGHVVGLVPGDPDQLFVAERVGDEVAAALEARGHEAGVVAGRVANALARVGLAGLQERPLATLSGGERQRVAIAAAIAAGPAVLLLDEPTSQLDDDTAASLVALLGDLVAQGTTVLVATHHPERFGDLPAARLALGPADEGEPRQRGGNGWVVRALPHARRAPRPDAPPAETPGAGSGDAVVWAKGVGFGWLGAPAVLQGLDLAVRGGEIVAVMGASGAGKTTLLRLLIGRLAPTAGAIQIAGRAPAAAVAAGLVGYVPQDPEALLFASSVHDELAATLAARGAGALPPDQRAGRIADVLATLGLSALAQRHPLDLSTGERQRTAIAAVLAAPRTVLLLDEPTRGLDDAAMDRLIGALLAVAAGGTAVVLATHDRRLAAAAHRRVVIAAAGAAAIAVS